MKGNLYRYLYTIELKEIMEQSQQSLSKLLVGQERTVLDLYCKHQILLVFPTLRGREYSWSDCYMQDPWNLSQNLLTLSLQLLKLPV